MYHLVCFSEQPNEAGIAIPVLCIGKLRTQVAKTLSQQSSMSGSQTNLSDLGMCSWSLHHIVAPKALV
jgi:hypothetical protein